MSSFNIVASENGCLLISYFAILFLDPFYFKSLSQIYLAFSFIIEDYFGFCNLSLTFKNANLTAASF